MGISMTAALGLEIAREIDSAMEKGVIDVHLVAQHIRNRLGEDLPLDDIVAAVIERASGAPIVMEFNARRAAAEKRSSATGAKYE